jgi:hypothetical protein
MVHGALAFSHFGGVRCGFRVALLASIGKFLASE